MAKILVVEDDLELAESVCSCLRFEHHRVEHTVDGADALHLMQSFKYDLVVLDWNLPGLSGVEILSQYRARDGGAPVLMLSGKAEIADKEAGLDAGADDYLTKPFNTRELSARVRALLRRPGQCATNVLKA